MYEAHGWMITVYQHDYSFETKKVLWWVGGKVREDHGDRLSTETNKTQTETNETTTETKL